MFNNTTETTPSAQPGYVVLIIAPFAFITILVNALFFFVGLKTLKKNAHSLFVIYMCGGDCLYGVSLFLLTMVNRNRKSFSELCLSQIIVYFISVNVTLTVALLICIERCITIKLRNFGQLMYSDGWKNKLAGALLLSSTGYVIMCFLVVPRLESDSATCDMNIFYDSYHYRVIMALLSGLFICLFSAIIIKYIIIVCILYKFTHQGRKVEPKALVIENIELHGETIKNEKSLKTNKGNGFADLTDNKSETEEVQILSNALVDITRDKENGENDDASEFSVNINTLDNFEDLPSLANRGKDVVCPVMAHHSGSGQSFKKQKTVPSKTHSGGNLIFASSTKDNGDGQHEGTTDYKADSTKLQAWKKWQLRALTTSGLIIGSTLLLFGPITVCLILDAFGISFPKAVGDTSALLVAFHCVINPFIYAFRFNELRVGIKNLICCKRSGTG